MPNRLAYSTAAACPCHGEPPSSCCATARCRRAASGVELLPNSSPASHRRPPPGLISMLREHQRRRRVVSAAAARQSLNDEPGWRHAWVARVELALSAKEAAVVRTRGRCRELSPRSRQRCRAPDTQAIDLPLAGAPTFSIDGVARQPDARHLPIAVRRRVGHPRRRRLVEGGDAAFRLSVEISPVTRRRGCEPTIASLVADREHHAESRHSGTSESAHSGQRRAPIAGVGELGDQAAPALFGVVAGPRPSISALRASRCSRIGSEVRTDEPALIEGRARRIFSIS